METNVAGLLWGWNKIVQDSRGNVALFDFGSTHAATKKRFQTAKGCFL